MARFFSVMSSVLIPKYSGINAHTEAGATALAAGAQAVKNHNSLEMNIGIQHSHDVTCDAL